MIIAGWLAAATGQPLWDTLVALAIGAFVAKSALALGREVFAVLGQYAPAGMNPATQSSTTPATCCGTGAA